MLAGWTFIPGRETRGEDELRPSPIGMIAALKSDRRLYVFIVGRRRGRVNGLRKEAGRSNYPLRNR